MMKRKYWLKIHLVLVGLFFPLLILIPLSGTLYLLGSKGEVKKTDAFTTSQTFTRDASILREILKTKGIKFDFESVKDKGNYVILRPSTRVHYEVHQELEGMKFVLITPNLISIMQELHFGHGPKFVKTLQIIFGFTFFLVLLSGLVLMAGLKGMAVWFFISSGIGTLLLGIALL